MKSDELRCAGFAGDDDPLQTLKLTDLLAQDLAVERRDAEQVRDSVLANQPPKPCRIPLIVSVGETRVRRPASASRR